jgi:hypothetical protein|tara:strand:+ start:4195 stop:4512 length:318 start_codon:yes stop_codon:yes gene_type:complete
MPPKKKTAPNVKKTSAVTKKGAKPKKVTATPAPPAPKNRQIELMTNTGLYTLSFTDDAAFEAAMAVVKSAPSEPTGSRSTRQYKITTPDLTCMFHIIDRYVVHES